VQRRCLPDHLPLRLQRRVGLHSTPRLRARSSGRCSWSSAERRCRGRARGYFKNVDGQVVDEFDLGRGSERRSRTPPRRLQIDRPTIGGEVLGPHGCAALDEGGEAVAVEAAGRAACSPRRRPAKGTSRVGSGAGSPAAREQAGWGAWRPPAPWRGRPGRAAVGAVVDDHHGARARGQWTR
jgi:hypothetical protein